MKHCVDQNRATIEKAVFARAEENSPSTPVRGRGADNFMRVFIEQLCFEATREADRKYRN